MKRVLFLPLYRTDDSPYKYMAIGGYGKEGGFTDSVRCFSKRYIKNVTVQAPYRSDGATCAPDIDSDAWWFHDVLCDRGYWDDHTPITNWQCSTILYDTMRIDGFGWARSAIWRSVTFIGGGGEARKNGMVRL